MVFSIIIILEITVSSAILAQPTSLSTKVPYFLYTRSFEVRFPYPALSLTSNFLRYLTLLYFEVHLVPVEQDLLLYLNSWQK